MKLLITTLLMGLTHSSLATASAVQLPPAGTIIHYNTYLNSKDESGQLPIGEKLMIPFHRSKSIAAALRSSVKVTLDHNGLYKGMQSLIQEETLSLKVLQERRNQFDHCPLSDRTEFTYLDDDLEKKAITCVVMGGPVPKNGVKYSIFYLSPVSPNLILGRIDHFTEEYYKASIYSGSKIR